MKNKSILLVIAILLVGLSLAGGTYAYLTMAANVTNGNYTTNTTCFNIDYNISNEGSGQDITGTLFPSSGPSGGLSGRVGIKVNASCSTNGLGTLKLHINSSTSSSLMTAASSYCQNRKTLEAISGISTEADCNTAGGRWQGYGDSFCEDPATLQRMTDYTTENACTGAGGTWKSGGSPLKYAVYDNNAATGAPLSKGYITSTDINNDKTIYTDFVIDSNQAYYYIFIWLDGYLLDNAVNDLPFSGYIKAEANQTNVKTVYTFNQGTWVTELSSYDPTTIVILNEPLSNSITQYSSVNAVRTAHSTQPFFLRHTVEDGIVSESYVAFIISSELAQENATVTAGTYYLRGGVDESSLDTKPIYESNKSIMQSAFSNCGDYSTYYTCVLLVSGAGGPGSRFFSVSARTNGGVSVDTNGNGGCDISSNTAYGAACNR